MPMENVLRKIKKSLALAHNNPNPDEAHTAMLMAQRLMAKHNLTASDIPGDAPAKKVDKVKICRNQVKWWERKLAQIIDENFRTNSFYSNGAYIGFIGLETDVKIAEEVFRFASESISYHASAYLKNNPERRSRAYAIAVKNDYITGYLSGLREKFRKQVESECLAVVLVKDALVVQATEEMNLKKGDLIRRGTANDSDALRQGYEDGLSFQQMSGTLKENF
ncbi:DUF2786 domain-containing protein [Bacillus sp. FSL K6-6540]|uniref:DUF2786 domain-containing protein n=1 Tax=Bacillus sp. FSL K6-6540 TaxID=2921512 RepID=UPI0030F8468D